MYDRRVEIRVRKSAARHAQEKRFQEPADKEITRDEVTCPACGFKARYQFIRCPECGAVRETRG